MIKAVLKKPSDRPRQQLPVEMIEDLMGAIRNSFYPGDQRWFKDQSFIKRNVVTWPAGWLNQRGVTLRPARYKEILLGVLTGIKQCGKTDAVKYWPGYLMQCVQSHFKIHGDEIYQEAKSLRNLVENALLAGQKAAEAAPGNDPVAAIAMAHQALLTAHRRNKKAAASKEQLTFL